MANKQLIDLTSKTSFVANDLLALYDSEEAGSEKLKKLATSDLIVTGTWTPVIADAATGGNASSTTATSAQYTKIGRLVSIMMYMQNIDKTGMNASNALYVRGLPFTCGYQVPMTVVTSDVTYSQKFVTALTMVSQTYMTLQKADSAASLLQLLVSDLGSGTSDIWINGTYFI
jgi:hypothetical protein